MYNFFLFLQLLKHAYNYIFINSNSPAFIYLCGMIKDLIILLLVGYLVYKVFSRFVMPIVRITNVANDQMNRMQQQMEEMQRKQQPEQPRQAKRVPNDNKEGEFIEYEEVK